MAEVWAYRGWDPLKRGTAANSAPSAASDSPTSIFSLSPPWERVGVRGGRAIHPHLNPPPSRGRKNKEGDYYTLRFPRQSSLAPGTLLTADNNLPPGALSFFGDPHVHHYKLDVDLDQLQGLDCTYDYAGPQPQTSNIKPQTRVPGSEPHLPLVLPPGPS